MAIDDPRATKSKSGIGPRQGHWAIPETLCKALNLIQMIGW